MKTVDMSEREILQRLRSVDRLRELCRALMKLKNKPDPRQTELKIAEVITANPKKMKYPLICEATGRVGALWEIV